ncbi:MAG: WD40 repeat domain-containing protein, partial [Gammaproteobacteria bacterium]
RHAYRSLPPAQQGAARRLLVSLVTPGEGREDTRARIPMPDDPDERAVIRRFSAKENRLLVTGTDPARQPTVEVSHEALIRSWDQLHEWVGASRDLLRIRARIRTDMTRWEANGRPASLLLQSGLPLAEARRLLEKHEYIVIDDLRRYIQMSLKRDSRRRQGARAAVAFGFLVIAAIAVFFYELQARATVELRRAVETDGRRLAQIAGRYLQEGRPHQAIMAAREAFGPLKENLPFQERPYVWQAADVLHRALAARPILRKIFRGHKWVVNMAAFSHDGKRIVTAGTDGRVFVLDARALVGEHLIIPNPETFKDNTVSSDNFVNWAAFSPDGERLATANQDGSVRIFSVRDGKQVLRFQ